MPRSGRLRRFISEYSESPRTRKMSFIPPFLILVVEIILIFHALSLNEMFVISLTLILLIISIIETMLVSKEIHEEYTRSNYDRILTIKLDDFITKTKEKNVKSIIEKFISEYPDYRSDRNEIYHTTCQILETHKKEKIEKKLTEDLNKYAKKNKRMNVDELVKSFVKKHPKYKNYRSEIYEKTCQIKCEE